MQIYRLEEKHKDDWLKLWQGYLDFYKKELPLAISNNVFVRMCSNDVPEMGGFIAYEWAKAVGIVNYIVHANTWSDKNVCYLEDLYVDEAIRGRGYGRALIEHLRDYARSINCRYLYWQTARTNKTAQELYNKVGYDSGFMVYKIDL